MIKYYRERYKRHNAKVMYGTVGGMLPDHFPTKSLDVRGEFNMIEWARGESNSVSSRCQRDVLPIDYGPFAFYKVITMPSYAASVFLNTFLASLSSAEGDLYLALI